MEKRICLRAGIFLALLAGWGTAQVRYEPSPVEENVDKEAMHEGLEIRIIGMEEGDNHFRDRTPALMNSDRKVALVDTDKLYDRKRAMYEEGARFHTPLPVVGEDIPPSRPVAAAPAGPAPAPKEGGGWFWKYLVLLAGAGAFLAALKLPFFKK